jgi:hypothetical protein
MQNLSGAAPARRISPVAKVISTEERTGCVRRGERESGWIEAAVLISFLTKNTSSAVHLFLDQNGAP